MSTPYTVRASQWDDGYCLNQWNGSADAGVKCGEYDVAMLGRIYGHEQVDPEKIKLWLMGPTNAGTYDTQLEAALQHFFGLPARTVVPNGWRNYVNGLLDIEWQALHQGIPLIHAGFWRDAQGWIYDGKHSYIVNGEPVFPPLVRHWRTVIAQTESTVTVADSSGGVVVTDSWTDHCILSDGVLIIPTVAP